VIAVKSVDEIARDIVRREGGYVNDPDDPGGATKFGVTIGTMRKLGLDLDGDNRITAKDVKKLTAKQATDIFLKHYYIRPKIDRLPEVLQASVFDMQVNAGAGAIKILQRLLREFGQNVSADGVIGPNTVKAANEAYRQAPDHIADAYGIARRNYYYALADGRVKSRKYARRKNGGKGGWIVRAEEFIDPRFHLSRAEHAERTAKWG